MLCRKEPNGILTISQPAHSWVSGQIARAWGRDPAQQFPEEVCLAAELHDVGFLEWELAPTLNPATGLPYTFLEMPTKEHLEIWQCGIRQMLRFGRLPALLVSLHFTNIARQNWIEGRQKPDLTGDYISQEEALQRTLQTSIINDHYYGAFWDEEEIRNAQQFVSIFDWLSLLLCHGARESNSFGVDTAKRGRVDLTLSPSPDHLNRYSLDPWPFQGNLLRLRCEGRKLIKRFTNQEEMRSALRAAAPETLTFELLPPEKREMVPEEGIEPPTKGL